MSAEQGANIPINAFRIEETYSGGWRGSFTLTSPIYGAPLSLSDMLSISRSSRLVADAGPRAIQLSVAMVTENGDGEQALCYWPSMIIKSTPIEAANARQKSLRVDFVDPVTYLESQTVWCAYREASIGEVFGGILSVALGGSGRPTLNPALGETFPMIQIEENVRSAIQGIPYLIASGQTLGVWLADVLGRLGVRYEMLGSAEGGISLSLRDSVPGSVPLEMTMIGQQEVLSAGGHDALIDSDKCHLISINVLPESGAGRGVLVDDILDGRFRKVGPPGSVGGVIRAPGIDPEEAGLRASFPAKRAHIDALKLRVVSREAKLRPGQAVDVPGARVTESNIREWQVERCVHEFVSPLYDNTSTLVRRDEPWHPHPPVDGPTVIVTGEVYSDGDYERLQKVPRDRIGRIPISFPFQPTEPATDEEQSLVLADKDGDKRITDADLDEFTDEERAEFDDPDNVDALKADFEAYQEGDFDDPYPTLRDDELSYEQARERADLSDKRAKLGRFGMYEETKAELARDENNDGYLTTLDTVLGSDEYDLIRDRLQNSADRQALDDALQQYEDSGELPAVLLGRPVYDPNQPAAFNEISREDAVTMLETYQRLKAAEDSYQAEVAKAQNWPPRIPLRLIQNSVGAGHGFLSSIRQGESCRVAIYNPMSADIIGFAYRDNLRMPNNLIGNEMGFWAEHDTIGNYTGLFFSEINYEGQVKKGERAYE